MFVVGRVDSVDVVIHYSYRVVVASQVLVRPPVLVVVLVAVNGG